MKESLDFVKSANFRFRKFSFLGLSYYPTLILFWFFGFSIAPHLAAEKVIAPDKAALDYHGFSVSHSGDTLAVGAYGTDSNGIADSGAAYLYRLEANGSVTYLSKVSAPDKAASDRFGFSVSQSGNILAVGAYQADPGGLSNAGAAYLYRLEANGTATHLNKVTAPDKTVSDRFGFSVSQSGNILAVGAHLSDPGGISDAGAAYLFQLEANGTTTYLTKVTAPDKAAVDQFGNSVSLSGNILAVGASSSDPSGLTDAGAAYLYRLEANGTATYLNKVSAPDKAAVDQFGISVSQSGNILAVGAYLSDPGGISEAGAAYLYRLETNGSTTYLNKITAPDKSASDQFGRTVSQSGNTLVVGSILSEHGGISEAGAAYLYRLEANGSTTYLNKFTAADKNASDQFGQSITHTVSFLGVGASLSDPSGLADAGAVYTYDISAITNRPPADLNTTSPLTISENQSIGSIVGEFNATDPDANATLTYLLVSGAGSGNNSLFSLDSNGTLKTATSFNYESNASAYSIRVQVKDEHNTSIEGNFTVLLTNLNEGPVDLNATASLSIAENLAVGSIVGEFNSTDPDANASLSYLLVAGTGDGNNSLFSLDANGTLKSAVTFNYETNASTYSIRVQAKDENNATTEQNFTISLTNANDPPSFTSNGTLIKETALSLAFGGSTPKTYENFSGNTDAWEFSYETYNGNGRVTLDLNGGVAGERYLVKLGSQTIFDSGSNWATNGTAQTYDFDRFLIDFTANSPTFFRFVPQSSGNNTSVDLDGADNIRGTTDDGILPVDSTFDNKSKYLNQLGLADDGSPSGMASYGNTWFSNQGQVTTFSAPSNSTTLTFRIESTTLFQLTASYQSTHPLVSVPENQTFVVDINATDVDGDTLTYSLTDSSDQTIFDLNASTGILSFKAPPNFESNTSSYDVEVRVSDGQANSNILLPVFVTNLNESPTSLSSSANLKILENQPVGTVVGQLTATDPDANTTLTYHLVNGSGDTDNSLFSLETNGTLKSAVSLDYESKGSAHSIRVQVRDQYNALLEGSLPIAVSDVYEPSRTNHSVDLNSSVNLEMIWVEPGTFTMGSPVNEAGATEVRRNGTQCHPDPRILPR